MYNGREVSGLSGLLFGRPPFTITRLLIARLLVTRLMDSRYSYYRLVGTSITEQISYLGVIIS